jgi:uncharacterized Ntn-hydrolase superfamily protein
MHPTRFGHRLLRGSALLCGCTAFACVGSGSLHGQVPEGWRDAELVFHTFSIAAVDPDTGEAGVAVTTRNACVGNGVPWVRAGVGAVATQAATRTEYGPEILDRLAAGARAEEALALALAADPAADRRQIGVASVDGGVAQHTGTTTNPWAGQRQGIDYVVQGNLLEGPAVVDAVARDFEASRGSGRHLADRLISALEAGQAEGGDARKGRIQSAAVRVADPREGMAQRPDGETVFIHVCEHPTPVAELRRIHDTVSGTLGYRSLEQFAGDDVAQLKIILHALGYYLPDLPELPRDARMRTYDEPTAAAVDVFRRDQGLSTPDDGSPSGLVDDDTVAALWRALDEAGKAVGVRTELRTLTRIRR